MATKQSKTAPAEREYTITAELTISVSKRVRASSEAEAIAKGNNLGMPGLCHECDNAGNDDDETWEIGGLDGEPCNIEVQE